MASPGFPQGTQGDSTLKIGGRLDLRDQVARLLERTEQAAGDLCRLAGGAPQPREKNCAVIGIAEKTIWRRHNRRTNCPHMFEDRPRIIQPLHVRIAGRKRPCRGDIVRNLQQRSRWQRDGLVKPALQEIAAANAGIVKRPRRGARVEAQRGLEVLDRQVDRSCKQFDEATPHPGQRVARIERERAFNKYQRRSDVLVEYFQRPRDEHENGRIVRLVWSGVQGTPDEIERLAAAGLRVFGPATAESSVLHHAAMASAGP